jgi:hypothetical protein
LHFRKGAAIYGLTTFGVKNSAEAAATRPFTMARGGLNTANADDNEAHECSNS